MVERKVLGSNFLRFLDALTGVMIGPLSRVPNANRRDSHSLFYQRIFPTGFARYPRWAYPVLHNLSVDSVRGRCEHILSMWRKEDVIQKLKDSQADRSLRSYADTLGCSPSYLCDLYSGKREPGEKILKQLGLEKKVTKTVTYVKRRWR
jgi:hypothetical protein